MTLAELNGHLDMVTQLHSARETLQGLQDRILGAQKFDSMPRSSEASRKVENLTILLEAQIDDVNRLEKIVSKSEKRIRKWIDAIPDNRTKVVFNLRFLCGLRWEDVGEYINANSTEAVKSICYRYLNITIEPE